MKRVIPMVLVAVFSAALLSVAVATQAMAQIAPNPPANPNQPAKVDDQQLRSFAKVYVQVEKIRETYAPRAKEAPGPEQGKQIQQEAESKFQEALTKEGLNEESYKQIFEVARVDQDVRKKVLQMIVEEKGKS